ncbi:MAG TPA: hypothetical protein VGQ95_13495 [Chthoniobacterales bacterium]|nr:hypothetical protein [Chthoniobacterales bacterium]
MLRAKDMSIIKPEATAPRWSGIALLLLVSLIAASFLYSPGLEDVRYWLYWVDEISRYGLIGGFAHTGGDYAHDYPPLAFVMLAAVARCADAFGTNAFIVLKCSLLLFLFATSGCFYWFTRNLALTAALEFTLLLSSVALGYLDIWFAPFLIAGLFYLQRGNLTLGVLLFTISCSIKWQPLVIAPFICIYVWSAVQDIPSWRDKLRRQIMPFAVAALVVAVPLAAIFGTAIIHSLQLAMSHDYLSGLALNFSWLHTWALHLAQPEKYGALQDGQIGIIHTDEELVKLPEKILFYASYSAVFVVFARQKKTFERLIVYSVLGYMAYFVFNSGVHENHLFLVVCLAWILVFVNSGHLLRCLSLSLAANINPILFYGPFGRGLQFQRVVAGVDVTLLFAVANLCLFVGLLLHAFKTDGVGVRFWQTRKR